MRKKILILTEVSSSIGLGHFKRVQNLSEILNDFFDINIFVQGFIKNQYIKDNVYLIDDFSYLLQPEYKDMLNNNDAILLDIFKDSTILAEVLSINIDAKVIQLSDSFLDEVEADIYFNVDDLNVDIINAKKKFIGTDFLIFSNHLLRFRPLEYTSKPIKKILIGFGGSDPGGYSFKVISEIVKLGLQEYEFTLNLGPLVSLDSKKEIIKVVDDKKNISVVQAGEVEYLLSISDLYIGLGGTMNYEAMLLGVPSIAVKWLHMDKYIENLVKRNLLLGANDCNELIRILCRMDNFEHKLDYIASNAFNKIDGQGKIRIVETIRGML